MFGGDKQVELMGRVLYRPGYPLTCLLVALDGPFSAHSSRKKTPPLNGGGDAARTMQSHLMNKRRSEVSVAPLRPLALNRATEILPYRGTLFLKGKSDIFCTERLTDSGKWAPAGACDGLMQPPLAYLLLETHARIVALVRISTVVGDADVGNVLWVCNQESRKNAEYFYTTQH